MNLLITWCMIISAWKDMTSGETSIQYLPGGHFYLKEADNQSFLISYFSKTLVWLANSRSQVAIIGTLLYLIKSRTIAIKMCHIKINFILFSPSYASPENPIHHSVIFKMTCQSRIFLCLSDKLNWNLTKTDDWCKEKKPNCAHVCWFSSRSSKTLQQLNGWIC